MNKFIDMTISEIVNDVLMARNKDINYWRDAALVLCKFVNEVAKVTQQMPKPVAFTVGEGDNWLLWGNNKAMFNNKLTAHAIKFNDGSIFDIANGWRQQPAITKQTGISLFKCRECGFECDVLDAFQAHSCSRMDERRVPRYPDPPEAPSDFRIVRRADILEIIEKLNKLLATEKSSLSAP